MFSITSSTMIAWACLWCDTLVGSRVPNEVVLTLATGNTLVELAIKDWEMHVSTGQNFWLHAAGELLVGPTTGGYWADILSTGPLGTVTFTDVAILHS
jgi:hypothetical protein